MIASWWLLREIEQAGIRLHTTHCEVIREGAGKKAMIRLPTSKTDPTRIGAERSLPYMCGSVLDWLGCVTPSIGPAGVLEGQIQFATEVHEVAPDAEDAWVLPHVADGDGRKLPIAEVVARRQEGFPAQDGIAGHPARRAGEKLLTKIGWALGMVKSFGRRASETVRGYVEEAYSENTIQWARNAADEQQAKKELGWVRQEGAGPRRRKTRRP